MFKEGVAVGVGGDCEHTAERAGGVKAFQDGEREGIS